MQRVTIVINDFKDDKKTMKALGKVPVLTEKNVHGKRKLFYQDFTNMMPLDWVKIKKFKKSPHQQMNIILEPEHMDALLQVYCTYRTTSPDEPGTDVLMAIVPGSAPSEPSNSNLLMIHQKMKKFKPKLQPPKIGTIRMSQSDIISRVRNARTAFAWSKSDDLIIHTHEGKISLDRAKMLHLKGGDTFVNEWPVVAVPFTMLARCTTDEHDKIFCDVDAVDILEDGDANIEPAETSGLGSDEVIPYPNALPVEFGMEVLEVHDVGVAVELTPNEGYLMKAVIAKNRRGVAFVKNKSQYTFLLGQLKEYVKIQRLVTQQCLT